MYTYKPVLVEDSAGFHWIVLVQADDVEIPLKGKVPCIGTEEEQVKALELEAQRLEASWEEHLADQVVKDQEKTAMSPILEAIAVDYAQPKPVPAKAEEPIEEQVAEISK